MIPIKVKVLKSPAALSILIHLVILLIFALIIIRPDVSLNWHEFEWAQNFTDILPKVSIPQVTESVTEGAPQGSETTIAQPTKNQGNAQTPQQAVSTTPQARVLELPTFSDGDQAAVVEKPAVIPGKRGKVPRPSQAGPGTASGNGYSFSGDGGIAIKNLVLPDLKVSDYGEVKLEFSVRNDMTVEPTTIRVAKSGTQPQNQSAIKALKQCTFTLTGMFNPDKRHSILFRFLPAER